MFRVVLTDANVLFGRTVRDYLLYAHNEGLIAVRWSKSILDELSRNLAKRYAHNPEAASAAHRLIELLLRKFPEATVTPLDEHLAEFDDLDLPDPDDQHVLAAAMSAEADVICTDDKQGFPVVAVERTGARVHSADDVLTMLMNEFPSEMASIHRTVTAKNPKLTADQTVEKLRAAGCPKAAAGAQATTQRGGAHYK